MMIYGFPTHTPQEKRLSLEVCDYHLIYILNGVFVTIGEGQTRTRSMISET